MGEDEYKAVTEAIAAMGAAALALASARARRDRAVWDLHRAGKAPGQIARATGMSASNVRLICDRFRLVDPGPTG